MMDSEDRLLVEVLATQDSLWQPRRAADLGFVADANYFDAKRDFPTTGVPWHSAATDEAGRKSERRRLDRLAADGLVRQNGSMKTLHVRLSPEGESYTRSLVGLPSLCESHQAVAALEHHARDGWASECVLICNSPTAGYSDLGQRGGRLLAAHDAIMLPALSSEFVVENSDFAGRVFYQITKLGHYWITTGAPQQPTDLPERIEEALTHYLAVRTGRREHLRSQPPLDPSEIGPPPLPVGGGPIRARNGIDEPPPRRRKRGRPAKSSEKNDA